ncbi:hypothetical protein TWF730_010251 [Orbilia blumenaviensis]|uniref:Nucleoside phosphorylase domain-containing protein n=1 Tax=Orbilia blumenaviensis TaxID=1796055 RepID=A0AAV9UMS6_9PEZI
MKMAPESIYTIAIVCALPLEMAAVTAMMDRINTGPMWQDAGDKNNYTLGQIGPHNVVLACLPEGVYGMTAATSLISWMLYSYRSVRFAVLVGIGGGVPSVNCDIRLGDVVVSKPRGTSPGIIRYDIGKAVSGGILPNGSSDKPPKELLTAMSRLSADHMMVGNMISDQISTMLRDYPNMRERFKYPGVDKDILYEANYNHVGGISGICHQCDREKLIPRPKRPNQAPSIFYGAIGSVNLVVKDGVTRDQLANQHNYNILCFEMEAAGLLDQIPSLVIRGICDYADSHKNKIWQEYAAATAAAYAKQLLCALPASGTYVDQKIPTISTTSRSMSSMSMLSSSQRSLTGIQDPPPSYIFMERFHLKESISLGSLIPDRRYPHQDALIPSISLEEGRDFSVSIEHNFNEFANARSKSNSSFKKALGRLFLPPPFKGVEGDIQILSQQSCVYTLLQPRALFKRLSGSVAFKEWLSNARTTKTSIYFIVGYRTVWDAQLIGKEMKPTQTRRFQAGFGHKTRYDTSGERVYAICLRKVKFENSIERVGTLDPTNEWRPFYKHRGAGGEAEEFISVDISDDDEVGSSNFGHFTSQSGEELWTGT